MVAVPAAIVLWRAHPVAMVATVRAIRHAVVEGRKAAGSLWASVETLFQASPAPTAESVLTAGAADSPAPAAETRAAPAARSGGGPARAETGAAVAIQAETVGTDDPREAETRRARDEGARSLKALREALAAPADIKIDDVFKWARAMSEAELKSALAAVMALEASDQRDRLRNAILRDWGRRDMAGALRMVESMKGDPNAGNLQSAMSSVLNGWAKANPQLALDWVSRYGDLDERTKLVSGGEIMRNLGYAEPTAAALQTAWNMPTADQQRQALWELSRLVPADQRSAFFYQLYQVPDPAANRGAIAQVMLNSWSKEDPRSAALWVDQHRSDFTDPKLAASLRDQVFYQWGRQDMTSALAAAGTQASAADPKVAEQVSRRILQGWADANPKSALEWVTNYHGLDPRTEWIRGDALMRNLGLNQATPEAARLVWSLPTVNQQRAALTELTRTLTPGERLKVLVAMQDDPSSGANPKALVPMVVGEWAKLSPREAAGWVQQIPDPAMSLLATRTLVNAWQRTAPADTLEWLQNAGTDAFHQQQMRSVMNTWAARDTVDSGRWLAPQVPNPAMDRMVYDYARVLSREDPRVALTWMGSITNPKLREQGLTMLAASGAGPGARN
ncbi:MAG: hypothetical protein U1F77_12715 [Kiritimatiellia bacterium]